MRTGFMREGSHELIAIEACPILAPSLAASARIASQVADALARTAKPLDIAVTATEAGLDISVKGHGPFAPSDRARVMSLAERLDLARFANHDETVVERRPPLVMIAGCRVLPPPGAFLQATALGEETLAGLAGLALAGRRRIADLFCGIGPFALRLARKAQVRAYDGDAAAIAALSRAVRETQGLKPIAAEARDLFRRPLLAAELRDCDAAILDPPRQGALAQAHELARSRLERIVYVSCNPSTFARDAAPIVQGGYRLEAVTPVDQFRYSAHVELVGVFGRAR
jgi:23S rRNA (uracil1939-C5)-methyltransferase